MDAHDERLKHQHLKTHWKVRVAFILCQQLLCSLELLRFLPFFVPLREKLVPWHWTPQQPSDFTR